MSLLSHGGLSETTRDAFCKHVWHLHRQRWRGTARRFETVRLMLCESVIGSASQLCLCCDCCFFIVGLLTPALVVRWPIWPWANVWCAWSWNRGENMTIAQGMPFCVCSSAIAINKRSLSNEGCKVNANGGWTVLNKLTCTRSSLTVCSCSDQSWECDELLMPQSAICASSCRLVPCNRFTCSKKPLSRPFRSLIVSLGSCSGSMVICGNRQPDVNQVTGDISMPVNDNKGLVRWLGWGWKHSDCSQ